MSEERLTDDEVARLPDALRRRYWAGLVGRDVPALTTVTLADAVARARAWLRFIDTLQPGARAVVASPGHMLHGRTVDVVANDPAFDLSAAGDGSQLSHIVFVAHPLAPSPIGLGPQLLRAPPDATPKGALSR